MKFNKIQFVTTWFPTREQNVAFDFQTRSMCALFARSMRERKLNFPEGSGLNVTFGEDRRDGHCSLPPYLFYWLESVKDVRSFEDLTSTEKKQFTVDLIQWAMAQISRKINVDPQPFDEVCNDIRASGYVNSWEWKKGSKASPDRKLKCSIFIDHEPDYFNIRARISSKGSVITEHILKTDSLADELIIESYLGLLVWLTNEEVELSGKAAMHSPIKFSVNGLLSIP